MAYWLVTNLTDKDKKYKCSNCGAQYFFFEETVLGSECPNCGVIITGVAVDHKEKYNPESIKNNKTEKTATAIDKQTVEKFIKQTRQRKLGTFERYMNDVCTYLCSKFPDADVDTIIDTASYISNRATVMCADLLWERDREWKRIMRQQSPKIKRRDENENRS